MTGHEVEVTLSFLVGGLLAGVIGGWVDMLTAYVKGR